MFKNLLFIFVAVVCSCQLLFAQNVFNPADPIVIYNSAATAGSATNPNQPAFGVMSKWIKTTRVGWTSTNFKSYIFNGMAFRLRFPNNYNAANASKYPVIVFFHGGGEIGPITDNEYHLAWGAQLFEQRINSGEWNGFLLFPQETSVGWDDNYFGRVNGVLDTLQKYNNSDPDKIIAMGLSSGGYGAVAYADYYPKRVAAALAASPASVRTLSGGIGGFVHVPVWMANGGIDVNPDPYSAGGFFTDFRNAGGNIYQSYYVNDGHGTWTDMWNQKNASGVYFTTAYWNSAHKAQPLLYFQNSQFCNTETISARMGITAGYFAYEWQQNNATIAGATGNEYTATQPGQYRVRFMRNAGGSWSAWSPSPVSITTKSCSTDTLYTEHFNADNFYNAELSYKINNYSCQNGIMTTGTDLFTQDATGVQGNRFLVHYTSSLNGCTYAAGDRVWNTYSPVTVQPNTNYEYSFYLGNQNSVSPAEIAPIVNGTALIAGSVIATGTGNASWKKYTYIWNSGAFTYADLGLINRSAVTAGNDFAIDEICFKLPPAVPVPACTSNTSPANGATLSSNATAVLTWAAAANATSYDVYLWTGATAPASPLATVTAASYTATGLTGSSLYNWHIVPKNSNAVAASGCGNNPTSFTTAATPTVPGCVTNVSPARGTVLTSSTTVLLAWTAASTATAYDLYIWKAGTVPAIATATVTGTSYSVTGLTASSLYNWYVVSKNAVGSAVGCNANATTFTTAAGPAPPACVTNVSPANGATVASSTSAALTWNAAATATSYDVYVWTGTTVPTSPTANVTGTSYTASGGTASTVYNWYVSPKSAAGAATGCSSNKTNFTTAMAPVIAGTGTGLKGEYYNSAGLTGSIVLSRTDATVNFDWGTDGPSRSIDGNTFSVRWTGYVQPQYSQNYTFYTRSDDGVRLWVNGVQLVNNWTAHSEVENSGTINLTAGVKYTIKMEYYENTGDAVAQLLWSGASTAKAIIPQKQLYLPGSGNRVSSDDVRVADDFAAIAPANHLAPSFSRTGVYPNPVVKGLPATLQLNSETGGTATVQIAGIAGNIIRSQQINLAPGGNLKTISTAGLAPGLYIIRVAGSIDKTNTFKLVVQ